MSWNKWRSTESCYGKGKTGVNSKGVGSSGVEAQGSTGLVIGMESLVVAERSLGQQDPSTLICGFSARPDEKTKILVTQQQWDRMKKQIHPSCLFWVAKGVSQPRTWRQAEGSTRRVRWPHQAASLILLPGQGPGQSAWGHVS